jgi:hypothetical protein
LKTSASDAEKLKFTKLPTYQITNWPGFPQGLTDSAIAIRPDASYAAASHLES